MALAIGPNEIKGAATLSQRHSQILARRSVHDGVVHGCSVWGTVLSEKSDYALHISCGQPAVHGNWLTSSIITVLDQSLCVHCAYTVYEYWLAIPGESLHPESLGQVNPTQVGQPVKNDHWLASSLITENTGVRQSKPDTGWSTCKK